MMTESIAFPRVIQRSSRRKSTLALKIAADGALIVQVPMRTSDDLIEQFIKKNLGWIDKKRQQLATKLPTPALSFTEGETIWYKGEPYILKFDYLPQQKVSRCELDVPWMRILLPVSANCTKLPQMVYHVLTQWYRHQAHLLLIERTVVWSQQLGVEPRSVRLSNPSRRWGSCDTHNNIRFNWRLIMAPLPLFDYIVAHELCHILHKNHAPVFWRTLQKVMPDCKSRRKALAELEPQLAWSAPRYHPETVGADLCVRPR